MDAILCFDLLPFLRLQFGDRLRSGLEAVNLLFDPEELMLETKFRDAEGDLETILEPAALEIDEAIREPHLIVKEFLDLDGYDWIMIGNIFDGETAQKIADEFEKGLPFMPPREG